MTGTGVRLQEEAKVRFVQATRHAACHACPAMPSHAQPHPTMPVCRQATGKRKGRGKGECKGEGTGRGEGEGKGEDIGVGKGNAMANARA